MQLIFLGAPGAGKGTQTSILGNKLGIPTISTGAILRGAINDDTPLGETARKFIGSGRLVPDDVIIDIVRARLAEDDCKNGFILDGMPRTKVQAEELEEIGVELDAAVYLEIEDKEIVERMAGRRVCSSCGTPYHIVKNPTKKPDICDMCGGNLIIRKDDSPETVRARLDTYHKETEPLIGFYKQRGLLRRIQNKSDIKEMTQAILEALGIPE